MSASPVARQVTQSQVIPSRRMVISSTSDLPNDYSTTPGGTFYSTTPGGTRIVYERNFLLQLRNSPMAKTPPNLQYIPQGKQSGLCDNNNMHKLAERKNSPDDTCTSSVAQTRSAGDSELFEMDL